MRYYICGYAPGTGGVPKLIEYIELNKNKNKNINLIHPLKINIKNNFASKLFNASIIKGLFILRCLLIRNKKICIIHHQSVGYFLTKFLIKNNSIDPVIYTMDNALFCLSSYNYRKVSSEDFSANECLKCLGGSFTNSKKYGCKINPRSLSTRNNITRFLEWMKKNKKLYRVISLSSSNASLLMKHFGDKKIEKLNFLTDDIKKYNVIDTSSVDGYDFVYHGSTHDAKGVEYFWYLASHLIDYKFFIPDELPSYLDNLPNINTKPMRWENGLKDIVINSRVIFTPSLWSNTPEASTLKSILHNGVVAMVKNKYGFVNEIPDDACIKLDGIPSDDALILKQLTLNQLDLLKSRSKEYLKKYNSEALSDMRLLINGEI